MEATPHLSPSVMPAITQTVIATWLFIQMLPHSTFCAVPISTTSWNLMDGKLWSAVELSGPFRGSRQPFAPLSLSLSLFCYISISNAMCSVFCNVTYHFGRMLVTSSSTHSQYANVHTSRCWSQQGMTPEPQHLLPGPTSQKSASNLPHLFVILFLCQPGGRWIHVCGGFSFSRSTPSETQSTWVFSAITDSLWLLIFRAQR